MTVKELKDLLKYVPDDFEIGQLKKEKYVENWVGEVTTTTIKKCEIHPIVDLKNKLLTLDIQNEK